MSNPKAWTNDSLELRRERALELAVECTKDRKENAHVVVEVARVFEDYLLKNDRR